MTRHKQEEAVLNWLKEFKKRNKPFKINEAETIFNPERFAETHIIRIESGVTNTIYYNSIQTVVKVKESIDSLI